MAPTRSAEAPVRGARPGAPGVEDGSLVPIAGGGRRPRPAVPPAPRMRI